MAIADAEPKKGEVDHTSTGSSSGSKDMKKLSHVPVKYSSLKEFSFSVPDVWDDLNVCIFLECCHENIAELRDHNCAEENKVWEKIAKSGLQRAGSISCFNVNYCLELAKCLKNFVNKNQTKMMDNEIFKILYDNVVDLLPHFEPGSAKVPRRRSSSQDKNKVEQQNNKHNSTQDSTEIVVEPFKSPLDSRSALTKISTVLSKYNPEDLMKSNARSAVWKEVRARTGELFGLTVNPKAFIEGYKDSVISTIKSTPGADKDAQLRSKIFLKLASDMLPYFDYIAPKSVKKADFIVVEAEVEEPTPPKSEPKKKKPEASLSKNKTKRWRNRRRVSAPRNHETEEPIEPAEDPAVDDPVNIPEPSGVTRSTTPRTYQRKKRTAEDDPLSFLDDWTTSLDENESPTDENEPESNSVKETKKEEPAKDLVEEGVPNDPPPAKRARRARALKAPSQDEANTTKKVLPSRQRAKRTEPPPPVAAEPEKKPVHPTNPPVPVASTAATTAGPLVVISKSKPAVAPVKDPSPFRPPEPARIDTIDDSSSDSDSVEDVPIIGNRFTVHRTETLDKPKTATLPKKGMNPVVRLVKMKDDDLALVRSTAVARTRPRVGRPTRKHHPSPPRSVSPVRTVETTAVRRRGRPPKNPQKIARVVQPEPTTSRHNAPSSSALVRPGRSNPPPHSTFTSSELTPRSFDVTATPVNGQAFRSNEFSLRPNLDCSPPEWFRRFVTETRQQEMWKVHQLMKMQSELLDAETRKRSVLEKILSVLHERYDRQ